MKTSSLNITSVFHVFICTDDWTLAKTSHNPVDAAYRDFSKAFDSVCHSKLVCKLQSFGIGGNTARVLASQAEAIVDR